MESEKHQRTGSSLRTLQTAIAATLLAVVGCCVPAVAGAVNWEEIASYPDARAYVDMDSVSRESNIGSIWLKLSYLAEQEFTTGTYRSNWMHTYFRCQDKLWAVKGGVLFSGPNLDGERIYETKVSDADLDWKVVDNGSFAEDAMNLACQTRASAGNDSVERLSIQAVAPDGPTRMLMGDHWTIYLDGEIDPDAAARFSRILAQNRIEDAAVYLNSPGGSLSAAVAPGAGVPRAWLFDLRRAPVDAIHREHMPGLLQRLSVRIRRWRVAVPGQGFAAWGASVLQRRADAGRPGDRPGGVGAARRVPAGDGRRNGTVAR